MRQGQLFQSSARSIGATLLLSFPLYFGCATPPGPPEPTDVPFVGPEISQAPDVDAEQILVAQLPSPGWEFTLDATREAYRKTNVFVSFRKTNPAFVYPQMIVSQRLATTVRSGTPIVVYARTLEFEGTGEDIAHSRVTLASPAGLPAEPPKEPAKEPAK